MSKYEVITDWNYESRMNEDCTFDIYHWSFKDMIAQEAYKISTIRTNDFAAKMNADWEIEDRKSVV